MEHALVLAAKTLLGLFLSALVGGLLYLITVPVVLSIWDAGAVNYALMATLTVAAGAGSGSFLAWLDREAAPASQALRLGLALAAALGGAWGGLVRGSGIYQLGGLPGLPELSVIIIGGVIGANVPMLAIGIARALRDPRI